jgi:hypothetical protein
MQQPDSATLGSSGPLFTVLWNTHRRRMLDLAFRMP